MSAPTGTGPRGPVPSPAELAAAVLHRIWPEAAVPDPAWRGRAADEAVLLMELCRWLEGCHRHGGPVRPAPTAVAEVFAGLAHRGAGRAAVRRFVRLVVDQVHVELSGPDGPGRRDRARRDGDLLAELLDRCYGVPVRGRVAATRERARHPVLAAGVRTAPIRNR